jgi:iron(III) transport system substrate-binding protein
MFVGGGRAPRRCLRRRPGGGSAGPREQDKVLQQTGSLTPQQTAYRDALKKFNDEVVTAAEKEGEMNWYACTEADEAQEMIDEFNKFYPKIRVNHVFGQGFTLVEKIAAEAAANKITADSYICGITSARNLTNREGIGMLANPPSALNPDVQWNWPPVEGNGLRPLWSTNGIAGLTVNTNMVPKDKYPKTWWDLVRDPYWQDQIRRGNVGIADPRASGFGHQILYGLRLLNEAEYGETYIKQLAELKPKKLATNADEVPRGELAAYIGGSITTKYRREKLPVELVCPEPGCVQSFLAPATVNGPHPNAARVWAEFWLTREGQQFLAEKQWRTIARTDIPVDPAIDWKNMKQLYFASEEHDKPTQAALEWNKQTRIWDY